MKLKYCITFSVILIVLFSLTAISAGEDVDLYSSAEDSTDAYVLQIPEKGETPNQTSSNPEIVLASDDNCDLAVNVSVDKAYSGDKFNRAGSEINWTVTAEVIEGVARNAKVHVDFSSNMEYVSCNKTIGEYDPSTRIWDIGDLSGSQSATLIILTRLKSDGHFNLTANATTDSIDINLLNNAVTKNTKSGTGNNGSNITQNSSVVNEAQHGPYIDPFEERPPIDDPIRDPHEEKGNRSENNGINNGGGSNGNSNGWSSNGNGQSISSRYRSNTDSVAMKTLNPAIDGDSASSILGGGDSELSKWISKSISAVIPPYDYTRIPILILALFLLILAGIVGYDKLKS